MSHNPFLKTDVCWFRGFLALIFILLLANTGFGVNDPHLDLYPYVTPPEGTPSVESVPDADPDGAGFIIATGSSSPFGLTADVDPDQFLFVNVEAQGNATWHWEIAGDRAYRSGTSGTWQTYPYGASGALFSLSHPNAASPAATLTVLADVNATLGFWKVPLHVSVTFDDGAGNGWVGDGYVNLYFEITGMLLQYHNGSNYVTIPNGGTIQVLKGTAVTFQAIRPGNLTMPSGKPVWGGTAGATGSGPATKTVTFNGTSTTTVTATYGNTVTANIAISTVSILEVTFTGGNALKTDNGTYGSDGTGNVRVPQYQAGATPASVPICYNWEASPGIQAKYKIEPPINVSVPVKLHIDGVQNGRTGTLAYDKDSTFIGGSKTESFTTSAKLAKLVDNTSYDTTWKISTNGGTSYDTIGNVSNALYVTAGTPGGGATTLKRIDRVTAEGKGLVNEADIVEKLWKQIAGPGNYQLGAPYPTPEWKILDGTAGECIAIANLFKNTIAMVGITPGSGAVMYLYADAGGGSHESTSATDFFTRSSAVGNNGHTALIGGDHDDFHALEKLTWEDFGTTPGDHWNNWEACYKYRQKDTDPWKWYAAGTGGKIYSSVQECMNDVCKQTRWRYVMPDWSSIGTCTAPGPFPERNPYH